MPDEIINETSNLKGPSWVDEVAARVAVALESNAGCNGSDWTPEKVARRAYNVARAMDKERLK